MGVTLEKKGHIAYVALNNPETKNALGPDTLFELSNAWDECGRDNEIRVVILYSALPDIFCSGMNLKTAIPVLTGMKKPETDGEKFLVSDWKAVGKALLRNKELDRPVIAAINGYCITGGFEMAMGCELRVAAEDAVFQMREAKLGIMPMSGSNVLLQRQIGLARAMEVLLTADNFSAATLYEWGFLNRVVPRDKLMDTALSIAEAIAGNGPRAIRGMVRCSRMIHGKSIDEGFSIEAQIGAPIFGSDDAREGVKAQKEKRKPNFK